MNLREDYTKKWMGRVMSGMVEKVARAQAASAGHLLEEFEGEELQAALDLARVAIEAMRDPTEEMKAPEGIFWDYNCHVCGGLKEGWQAMIDAALDRFNQITANQARS